MALQVKRNICICFGVNCPFKFQHCKILNNMGLQLFLIILSIIVWISSTSFPSPADLKLNKTSIIIRNKTLMYLSDSPRWKRPAALKQNKSTLPYCDSPLFMSRQQLFRLQNLTPTFQHLLTLPRAVCTSRALHHSGEYHDLMKPSERRAIRCSLTNGARFEENKAQTITGL